ncbi:MAG: hypothetical protein JXK94_05485 [Deltaproteobacteria bacterium]|nr:hypothetical protein [Deltaproteobacteria bacterium]
MTYRIIKALPSFFIFILLLTVPSGATAGDGVFTFWPLVDYRYSSQDNFYSWKFLGPFFKYEKNGSLRQRAFRPFYYRTDHLDTGSFQREILFPVSTKRTTASDESFHVLNLWNRYKLFNEGKPDEVNYHTFSIFPLIFFGQTREDERYFAFFPFGGTIKNRFQRDEINFFLFPLYGKTERNGTTTRNILWPIYAAIEGDNESGTKIWPLWGASEKKGVYKKRFFLWPLFFRYDLNLDSEAPEKVRAFLPFYVRSTSTNHSSTHILWPFFSHIQDREKGYEEWNYPWPLFRKTEGQHKQSTKYLPFYADERVGEFNKRWFLWPLYKVEEVEAPDYSLHRDRVLFFLYSNFEENHLSQPEKNKKRIAFWPFFTYEKKHAITDFFFLSLAEPFFPENEAIGRIWGPLWRIYQHRYDGNRDIEVSSFLWNLYWKERHGTDLAWELFPLFNYRNEQGHKKMKLLKGLFSYSSEAREKSLGFLYLPWKLSWKKNL